MSDPTLVPAEYLTGLLDCYHAASQLERMHSEAVRLGLMMPRTPQADAARQAEESAIETLCEFVDVFRSEVLGEDDDE